MRHIVIGIDPGQRGGVATLHPDGSVIDLRVMTTAAELARYLDETRVWLYGTDGYQLKIDGLHVWLEKAQAMPKQGIASAFNYGAHFGELCGVLAALQIPHTLVRPHVWGKTMHAGTKAATTKVRSLEAARRLLPSETFLATPRSKVPHDGLVEAYLVAEYGRRSLGVRS